MYYYAPIPSAQLPIYADGDNCVFLVSVVNLMQLNPDYVGKNETIDVIVGMRWKFTISDDATITNPQTIKMHRVELYYPKHFLGTQTFGRIGTHLQIGREDLQCYDATVPCPVHV